MPISTFPAPFAQFFVEFVRSSACTTNDINRQLNSKILCIFFLRYLIKIEPAVVSGRMLENRISGKRLGLFEPLKPYS
ncbi:MAG: hypothetical protein J6V11_01950, partial [Alphaproteobacteria bacterium]|nr:hypothetical protein [Alphaproteobacteria bacterium]